MLREDRSGAASILTNRGLTLAGVRDQVVKLLNEAAKQPPENLPDPVDGHALLDSIKRLVDHMREKPLDTQEAAQLSARIQRELECAATFSSIALNLRAEGPSNAARLRPAGVPK